MANFGDSEGNALTGDTQFAVLVALDGVTSFDGLVLNDTISVGETVGNGSYVVLQVGTAALNATFGVTDQVNVDGFETAGTDIANDIAIGNEVALFWFPELSTSDSVLDNSNTYGYANAADWVLPTDQGGSLVYTNINLFGSPLTADQIIGVIPEPASTTLLGLGGLALLARRRRA